MFVTVAVLDPVAPGLSVDVPLPVFEGVLEGVLLGVRVFVAVRVRLMVREKEGAPTVRVALCNIAGRQNP